MVDQIEVLQHIEGLGADRFPLAGDQIVTPHTDRRQPLTGEQVLDPSLAEEAVAAQVGAPLHAGHQQAAPQAAGGGREAVQLEHRCLQQLAFRKARHHPLAEHAQLGLTQGAFPAHQLAGGQPLEPAPFLVGQVEGIGSGLVAGDGLAHILQPLLQLFLQEGVGLGVDHLDLAAGQHLATALFEGGAVDHRRIGR